MLPSSGTQDARLHLGRLNPVVLLDLETASGTLRFCTDRAVEYQGQVYQPYLQGIGTLRTAANFPDNQTTNKEYQLQFENGPVTWAGTNYPHLSNTFDLVPWELAGANVSLVLFDESGSIAASGTLPLVSSGVSGIPSEVTRQSFGLGITTRNLLLNDLLPMRPIRQEEFPEADRDELNGKTYIPIVVGEAVRVRARATAAGATTTVTAQVSTGTDLEVSETTGFANGDSIIINGFLSNPFTIGSVDTVNKTLTGLSPNLNTLGTTIEIGTVVREDKSAYDFTVANHLCGDITEVRVKPHGASDFTTIAPGLYSKQTVSDPKAIDGLRTDVRITEIISIGSNTSGQVTQQPVATVDDGNHAHNTAVLQINISPTFAGATSGPSDASNANDGNAETVANVNTATVGEDVLTFSSFPSVAGNFVEQRYYAIMSGPVVTGDVRIRRSSNTFLTLSAGFAMGEFRGTIDTGGSDTSDFTIVVQTAPTQALVGEAWKEVSMSPDVSEDLIDLTATTRIADVEINVSGADIEVGDVVEVVIGGAVDDGSYGEVFGTPLTRPDKVFRWIFEKALGQTNAIRDLDSYAEAGAAFAAAGTEIAFALEEPTTVDALFDNMADNSGAIHWWGRNGHKLRVLEPFEDLPEPVAIFRLDEAGVMSLTWANSFSALDIRNQLTAFYGRDWTRSANQDESYTGSVVSKDSASQARYGIRRNEVRGAGTSLYFDMVPTAEQAQSLLNLVTGHKAFPRKEFEIETEWTAGYQLEPGDVIQIEDPTLLTDSLARIIEHTVDPNFLCKIVAREVGSVAESVGLAVTDWHSPQSATSVASANRQWDNPTNVFASDDARATASMLSSDNYTEYLQITNFGFAIPADVTIEGVEQRIERRRAGADDCEDFENYLVIGNVIGGDSRVDIFNVWPSTDTQKTYGAADDTWTNALTPANVNDSGFGCAIQCRNTQFGSASTTPSIDHVEMRVHYRTT